MSDWHVKGLLDRWGAIEWVFFHHNSGFARPSAVIADYEFTQLLAEMGEQRVDLDVMRMKPQGKSPVRK